MATTGDNGASNTTPTSSSCGQEILIPYPRHLDLSLQDEALLVRYLTHVYPFRGRENDTLSHKQVLRKSDVLRKMTEEQKRTFPIMADEKTILDALGEAVDLKDDLKELVRELRLEADNEIDHERERC